MLLLGFFAFVLSLNVGIIYLQIQTEKKIDFLMENISELNQRLTLIPKQSKEEKWQGFREVFSSKTPNKEE